MKRDASVRSKFPTKRAKLNLSAERKKEDNYDASLIESSDQEEEFEEPKPWSEAPWLNSENEVVGVNIKGKNKKVFKTLSEKVQNLMKKRQKIFRVNGTKIKVAKHSFKKDALCCDVEVESSEGGKENIEATFYRPGGTITLVRKPDADLQYLELLKSGLICFLDKFLSGATEAEVITWSSRNSKPITVKTAISSCNLCTFETKSKVALKRHYTIVHTGEVKITKEKEYKCNICQQSFSSNDGVVAHKENSHGNSETEHVKNLMKRIVELENIVSQLQKKEADKSKDIKDNTMDTSDGNTVESE